MSIAAEGKSRVQAAKRVNHTTTLMSSQRLRQYEFYSNKTPQAAVMIVLRTRSRSLRQTKVRNEMWSIIGYCGLIVLEAVAVSATMSSQMESSWSASFILINVLGLAPDGERIGKPPICVSDGGTGLVAVADRGPQWSGKDFSTQRSGVAWKQARPWSWIRASSCGSSCQPWAAKLKKGTSAE